MKQEKNERIEDWRNEHGRPSFDFLQSLADDGGPVALEKLRSIAEDMDVSYDLATPAEQLVKRIILATQNNPDNIS